MTETWTHERAELREKLGRLAGRTSWREPVAGYTNKAGEMSDEQKMAAAMGFARHMLPTGNPDEPWMPDPEDVGPDVAICYACETRLSKPNILARITQVLCREFAQAAARPLMTKAAVNAAFEWAIFGHEPDPAQVPKAGMTPATYRGLILVARGAIIRAGEEAIYRAERAYYGRAA